MLVNNAGDYGPVKPVEEITPEEFDRVIAVHLRGAFLLTRLALPEMYARGTGAIVNISSLSAKSAFPWGSALCRGESGHARTHARHCGGSSAARRARQRHLPRPGHGDEDVQGFGNTLAARLGVNPDVQLAQFLEGILQGRGQTAEEIASMAAFLASDQASAITGQSVNVDGGAAFF